MKKRIKIMLVAGARPNFMKAAPLVRELKKHKRFQPVLVHTGQHYDKEMSDIFFKQLKLSRPDIALGIGSGSHASQTGRIMIAFDKVCAKEKPDLVVVVGDVNSTIACALVAAKMHILVAHVEAGLRSFDWTMPEEINRVLTDHVSDFLFTTCKDAHINLKREGISQNKIFYTGNVMIDTLLKHIKISQRSDILKKLRLKENHKIKKYAALTLHRPCNVDDKKVLRGILDALNKVGKSLPVIFPVHPRTMKNIRKFKLGKMVTQLRTASLDRLKKYPKVVVFPAIGYLDFLCLMSNATVVLTDSGGIQEETTILGIPCLTLRHNTERPITIRQGINMLVGNDPKQIVQGVMNVLRKGKKRRRRIPKYWDGKAAQRIVKVLLKKL